ncbi:NADH-quinone oxidoreductase subunit NuoE [Candidatus Poribacteria bacterium]|nr:NADH-quinone oxidoreductase subunit NuoE [Candidatus Poribacteria bacterium]
MTAVLTEQREEIEKLLARYPSRRSGMLPLLWMVQRKTGWVSQAAMAEVADILGCTTAEVYEVVSFYTMFHQKPAGKYHLALCDTLSCAACGSMEVAEYLKTKHGVLKNQVTTDGRFSLEFVECLGACANAPAMLVNEDLHGDLTPEKIELLLASCQ